LAQAFALLGCRLTIVRCDRAEIAGSPDLIVIGPGPGRPEEGPLLPLVREAAGKVPLFGVCLGMQAIAAAFGADIRRSPLPRHGKTSRIRHGGEGLFSGCPPQITVCRYHSLAVDKKSFPNCLKVTAETDEGEIMALKHRSLPIEAVQFHPESIATEHGMELLENSLRSLTCKNYCLSA